MPEEVSRVSLREEAAFQLANVTKTAPQFGAITPRWLVRFLDWKPLESGTFRVNKVDESKAIESLCAHEDESPLPATFADYRDTPREYRLSSINAVLNVHTRVSDLLSNPYDQVREQLRIAHREREGKAGERTAQQCRLWLAEQRCRLAEDQDAQGRANAGRSGRAADQGLERALVLPGASARHRGLWARVHAARRAAANGYICLALRS